MNTQSTEGVLSCISSRNWIVHSKIPQPDLSVPATRNQLSQAASLHVDVRNPLLMLTPDLNHGCCWLETLVKDTDSTVAKPSHENIARDLIRCQGSDA